MITKLYSESLSFSERKNLDNVLRKYAAAARLRIRYSEVEIETLFFPHIFIGRFL